MTRMHRGLPIALTIAGSDSGGGAGIQADLKTFAAVGVYGTTVITCLTAQNPGRVIGVQPTKPDMVRRQLQAVFEALPPQAIKTGMLFSGKIIRAVARFISALEPKPALIIDPVLVASSGHVLIESSGIKTLEQEFLPLADLITPNLPEAEVLARLTVRAPEQMRAAARKLHEKFGCAVLIKGGHLQGYRDAVDIFFDGHTELLLTAPRTKSGHKIHGTGCTYSAAITAYRALGLPLSGAVQKAKQYISQAIARSTRVAGHQVLA